METDAPIMRRTMLAPLVALVALVAGCALPTGTKSPDAEPSPFAPPPSDDPLVSAMNGWASAEDALIRPGVQVVSETGQCTANFVFTDTTGTRTYLGLAAHCVEDLPLGAPLDVAHGAATGTLAYSSWMTMKAVGESDAAVLDLNDFALVLLPAEARAKVSPAMLHFGGPIGLADSSALGAGDKVLTYGNSGLRQEADPLSWKEGYVLESSAWSTTIYTLTPGIPGDSGSGVLTGDGKALGILVTLTVLPTTGSNGVTHLDQALAYAAEHAGIDVQLATWDLLDGGVLPS